MTSAAAISGWRCFARAIVLAVVLSGPRAHAEGEAAGERRLYLSFGAGLAFNYESRTFSGVSPGASYAGWAPVLDVAVGRKVGPGLVVAGDLQLASVVNRTESYLGGSYPLTDTLHFLDSLSLISDYTPRGHPRLHFGGGAGILVVTELDTQIGSTATDLGFVVSVHAGYCRRLARAWSIGVMGRLTIYGYGSDTPAPESSSIGVLPVLLLTFTR